MEKELVKRMSFLSLQARALWGLRVQMTKACEEMGELITQLCKVSNNNPQATDEKVVDEIADALITIMQMRDVWGPAVVDARIRYKLDRLEKALLAGRNKPPSDVL